MALFTLDLCSQGWCTMALNHLPEHQMALIASDLCSPGRCGTVIAARYAGGHAGWSQSYRLYCHHGVLPQLAGQTLLRAGARGYKPWDLRYVSSGGQRVRDHHCAGVLDPPFGLSLRGWNACGTLQDNIMLNNTISQLSRG